MKFIAALVLTLAAGIASAQSKSLSCANLLDTQVDGHYPQEANQTPLFELGLFRGVFAPAPGEKSWQVAQARGQGGDFSTQHKVEAKGVSERLNGLYDDLDRTRDVSIYAFKKVGAEDVRAYLDRVLKSNDTFTQSVKTLWKTEISKPLQLGPALPVTGALMWFGFIAGQFPEQAARIMTATVAAPLVAYMIKRHVRRTQYDSDLMAHMNFVDNWVGKDSEALKKAKPYSYYSQNLEMPRTVFRELLAATGDPEMVNTLAKEYMARNPVDEVKKLREDKPEMVKVFLDQMFFVEDGMPTVISYVRERRETPQEISRRNGGGGERVLELQPETEAQMELVPVPIRVRKGDRR